MAGDVAASATEVGFRVIPPKGHRGHDENDRDGNRADQQRPSRCQARRFANGRWRRRGWGRFDGPHRGPVDQLQQFLSVGDQQLDLRIEEKPEIVDRYRIQVANGNTDDSVESLQRQYAAPAGHGRGDQLANFVVDCDPGQVDGRVFGTFGDRGRHQPPLDVAVVDQGVWQRTPALPARLLRFLQRFGRKHPLPEQHLGQHHRFRTGRRAHGPRFARFLGRLRCHFARRVPSGRVRPRAAIQFLPQGFVVQFTARRTGQTVAGGRQLAEQFERLAGTFAHLVAADDGVPFLKGGTHATLGGLEDRQPQQVVVVGLARTLDVEPFTIGVECHANDGARCEFCDSLPGPPSGVPA